MLVDRMGLVVRRGVRVIGGRLGIPQRGPSVLSVCLSPEGREIESDSANDLDFASLADGVCGVVAWAGPIPVRIEAGSKADREVLVDLVRLVHRLGCASRVRVVGEIGNSTAMELVDRGLEELVVELRPGDSIDGLLAVLDAKARRSSNIRVFACLPWKGLDQGQVADWVEKLNGRGLYGLRVGIPWRSSGVASSEALGPILGQGARELVRELDWMFAADDGLPGWPRRSGRCSMGSERLEIGPGGRLCSCPFQAGMGHLQDGPPEESWRAANAHRAAIWACERACGHDQLRPAGVVAGAVRLFKWSK
jgi:hypothetical protein